MGAQRDREIDTASDAIQPSPVSKIASETPSPGQIQAQVLRRLRRCEWLTERPMEFLDDPPILSRNPRYLYDELILAHLAGLLALLIYRWRTVLRQTLTGGCPNAPYGARSCETVCRRDCPSREPVGYRVM